MIYLTAVCFPSTYDGFLLRSTTMKVMQGDIVLRSTSRARGAAYALQERSIVCSSFRGVLR